MYQIVIQRSEATGSFHPAYYQFAPFPGTHSSVNRFKSKGHHTLGFETIADAQVSAAALAAELGVTVPTEGFAVRNLPEAGVDIILKS